MGNEFGHPEWIDFPRVGNNDSYHYARRRWDLAKDPNLRHHQLWSFDQAMHTLEKTFQWLTSPQAYLLLTHEDDKIIAFERAGLIWVFNLHPSKSYTDYPIGAAVPGKYKIVLDSDHKQFGGFERITKYTEYFTLPEAYHNQPQCLKVYIPSRVVLVFAKDILLSKISTRSLYCEVES